MHRGCLIGFGVLILLGVAFFRFTDAIISAPTTKTSVNPVVAATEQRRAFARFNGEIMGVMSRADKLMDEYQSISATLASGGISSVEAYSAIRRIKDANRDIWLEMGRVKPPAELSKDQREILRKSVEEFKLCLFSREKAYDATLKMIDDYKPSHADDAKQQWSHANTYLLQATAKLVQVKTEVEGK